jgi:hypothetical protein
MGEPRWLAAQIARYGSRNSFIVGIIIGRVPNRHPSREMSMKIVKLFVCVAALVVTLGVGAAAPASAVPAMSGHYVVTETPPGTGQTTTNDWYFTPCGDGCADVQVGGAPYGQARLVNGQWTLDGPGATVCPDGTKVPNAHVEQFTWDPSTLAGTARITENFATCGTSAPESWTNNLQLRQAP